MDVITKDATITNTGPADAFPGTFRVVLSTPTLDRDGEEVHTHEWKTPLPEHITFDTDHGLSVASTVGSGKPYIDKATGNLIVDGTYASLAHAQDTRTLVNEKHIRTTSVTFRRIKGAQKDGRAVMQRELLNGSFVSVPANPEAIILDSKSISVKAGARNSKQDQFHLDEIARHAAALGANFHSANDDPEGGDTGANPDVAAAKGLTVKDADTEDAADPAALIAATDAAIDEAIDLFASVDTTTLPAEVQQAIALIQAADAAVDELLDALDIPDPDEDADTAADSVPAPAAAKAAPGAATKSAPVEDHSIDQQLMAARKRFYTTLNEGN